MTATPIISWSFTRSGPGLRNDESKEIGPIPAGMSVNQAFGNLNVITGTTPGDEYLIRSVVGLKTDQINGRYKLTMPTRNAHQNVVISIADLVAEDTPCRVDSTGLLISFKLSPERGWNDDNLGQMVMLGGVRGVTLSHPGRYRIVAIADGWCTVSPVFSCTWSRNTTTATITFLGGNPIFALNETATVSASSDVAAIVNGAVTLLTQTSGGQSTFTCLSGGATTGTLTLTMTAKAWTADATGTLTVYGHSALQVIHNGTSATAMWFDSIRRGWGSGDGTVTSDTTAAPGAMIDMHSDGRQAIFQTWSPATGTTATGTQRGSRQESIPPEDFPLYFFFSVFNGVSAPASSVTVTLGRFFVDQYSGETVTVTGGAQQGAGFAIPVRVPDGLTLTGTNSVQISSATPTLIAETSTNLGSGATYTGASRDGGSTAVNQRFAARFFADQAGTARVEMSTDGSTWRRATADTALAANGVVEFNLPAVTRYHRCILVNGGTAQGAVLVASAYFKN
jgi:hypothetical protein